MLPRISFTSGWRSIFVLATCLFLSANRLGAEYVNFEAPHKGYFYLVRGRNACGVATFGGDGGADGLVCAGP
jgi:hypothetical protein